MTQTTSWVSGGNLVTVTTTLQSGQSVDEFFSAHTAAVRAELIVHPKD